MIIDIANQFFDLVDINLLHLVIFLLGILVTGTSLYHISYWLGIPESISTPLIGLGSLFINVTIMKEILF
jgi:hypothetical protein